MMPGVRPLDAGSRPTDPGSRQAGPRFPAGGERGRHEHAGHLLLGGVGAEGAGHGHVYRELVPVVPEGGVGLRLREGHTHLVGVAAAGLDLEAAARHLPHHLVVLGRFARAGVETDADAELGANVPLGLDELLQVDRVGVFAGALGDLEHHRSLFLLAGFNDRLEQLHVVHVERAKRVLSLQGFGEKVACMCQRHIS